MTLFLHCLPAHIQIQIRAVSARGQDGFLLFASITTRLLNDWGAILSVQFLCFPHETTVNRTKARLNGEMRCKKNNIYTQSKHE